MIVCVCAPNANDIEDKYIYIALAAQPKCCFHNEMENCDFHACEDVQEQVYNYNSRSTYRAQSIFLQFSIHFVPVFPPNFFLYVQIAVVFGYMGVSIVLYIVSRFSPEETRPMTVMTPNNNFTMQMQAITTHQTTSANEFTLLNSFWFSIAALMQQGCDFMPRSLPGALINFSGKIYSLYPFGLQVESSAACGGSSYSF